MFRIMNMKWAKILTILGITLTVLGAYGWASAILSTMGKAFWISSNTEVPLGELTGIQSITKEEYIVGLFLIQGFKSIHAADNFLEAGITLGQLNIAFELMTKTSLKLLTLIEQDVVIYQIYLRFLMLTEN